MKINKKGSVLSVILFIIGGAVIIFAILGFIGIGLIQQENEQTKQNCLAVKGTVEELGYDNSIKHYYAIVSYVVDGEEYLVRLDTATSNNYVGTAMTVYCDPTDPTRVLDEWNSRDTYNTYKAGFVILGLGIMFIFFGIKARSRSKIRLSNSGYNPPPNPLTPYTGYNGGNPPAQQYNPNMNQGYNPPYGNPTVPDYSNPYNNPTQQPPYDNQFGNPAVPDYNNPYNNPTQQPYNNQFGNPAAPDYNNPYNNPTQQSYNNPYSAPYYNPNDPNNGSGNF